MLHEIFTFVATLGELWVKGNAPCKHEVQKISKLMREISIIKIQFGVQIAEEKVYVHEKCIQAQSL